jgi:biopolymer transport protein ExbB
MTHFSKIALAWVAAAVLALGILAPNARAQETAATSTQEPVVNLDELLERVRQGIATQTKEFQQREAEFRKARDQQRTLLNNARAERANEEARSKRLEDQFKANEVQVASLQQQLRDKLGNLSEVFGVLQQVAGDTRSVFQNSYISLQFPGRDGALNTLIQKAAEGTDLPTIEEIEGLWYEMQREMTESAKIVSFETQVDLPDGTSSSLQMTRVGDFNVVANGKYYVIGDAGKPKELPRQPPGRFTGTIDDLIDAAPGELVSFGLDPSRGQLLGIYIETPTFLERVQQGKTVGYITIVMGAIGIILILWRWVVLFGVGARVRRQIKDPKPNLDNPLGRVLQVYHENKKVDVETLELKLDEAILRETPALEKFLTLVKLISAVAPLLGLLGTVTGMIETFQAITLFGTGDPKLMAGGISQALVTTVIGLVVAIPTLLLHSVVAGISRRIIHTLEEQSAGIIAVHAEKH